MVTIFVKPNCQPCKLTKRKLDEMGVEYETRDITEDGEALVTVKGLGYLSAPVVLTEIGEHWNGFRPDLISTLA